MMKASGRNKPMTSSEIETVEQVWPTIAPVLFVPHSEREYDRLVQMLDSLIDAVGEEQDHPLPR
jgi:HTH-type transcriptional regulator / antitoxin HigA